MKKYLLLTTFALFVLSGCTQVGQSANLTSNDSLTYDWGDINIAGGLVTHEFEFENTSEIDLIIEGAATSCMCTTAQFEFEGENYSPKFGMNNGLTNWSQKLAPGEEFEFYVTFDPLAHGLDSTGIVQRTALIYVEGNDNPIELKLFANVLSEKDYEKKYGASGFAMGDFVFEENKYDFGTVKQSGGIVSYEFKFEYTGYDPVTITGIPTSCPCTSASTETKQLSKGDIGTILVEFDPNLHEEPDGKFFKTITVLTDPEQKEEVELKIWAEIDLDLGAEAYKLKDDHIE